MGIFEDVKDSIDASVCLRYRGDEWQRYLFNLLQDPSFIEKYENGPGLPWPWEKTFFEFSWSEGRIGILVRRDDDADVMPARAFQRDPISDEIVEVADFDYQHAKGNAQEIHDLMKALSGVDREDRSEENIAARCVFLANLYWATVSGANEAFSFDTTRSEAKRVRAGGGIEVFEQRGDTTHYKKLRPRAAERFLRASIEDAVERGRTSRSIYSRRREHDVREHWRTYKSGKQVLVKSHKRGDPHVGRASKVFDM